MVGCFWPIHINNGGCIHDYCNIEYKDAVFWKFYTFDLVKKREK